MRWIFSMSRNNAIMTTQLGAKAVFTPKSRSARVAATADSVVYVIPTALVS